MLLLFLVFVDVGHTGPATPAGPECPQRCSCMWRKGKETVICRDGTFSEIPRLINTNTQVRVFPSPLSDRYFLIQCQVLDLTNNVLSVLARDAFSSRALVHLQDISLSRCSLHRLSRFSLRNLTNLVKLNLNSNHLTYIPSHAFSAVTELRSEQN